MVQGDLFVRGDVGVFFGEEELGRSGKLLGEEGLVHGAAVQATDVDGPFVGRGVWEDSEYGRIVVVQVTSAVDMVIADSAVGIKLTEGFT